MVGGTYLFRRSIAGALISRVRKNECTVDAVCSGPCTAALNFSRAHRWAALARSTEPRYRWLLLHRWAWWLLAGRVVCLRSLFVCRQAYLSEIDRTQATNPSLTRRECARCLFVASSHAPPQLSHILAVSRICYRSIHFVVAEVVVAVVRSRQSLAPRQPRRCR